MQDTPGTYGGELRLVRGQKAATPRTPRDVGALSNAELLTLLLGASREASCQQLTTSCTNLRSIATLPPVDLREHGDDDSCH